ncbi:MAG: CBS domain-containing protein [Clostridium fessum]
MNILFFLTPKSEVIYVNEEDTVGQAMDTMEKYKYSAVPIITKAGRYAGTLTEGDLLWGLKNKTDLVQKGLEKVRITEIPRRSDNPAGTCQCGYGRSSGKDHEPEFRAGAG